MKTLGQVACNAWKEGVVNPNLPLLDMWQAVADAVVAAHEARRLKPIETAPKDGTLVDLWSDNGRWPDCKWDEVIQDWTHWWGGGFDVMGWVKLGEHVTHWATIPAPPQEVACGA